jgi:hypothetical protein
MAKRLIFVRKAYLISHHPTLNSIIMSYQTVDTPFSLPEESRKLFIPLFELKQILTGKMYNLLLTELLKSAKGFDQINIVFDNLLEYRDYDADAINFIIAHTINNRETRNSFQAQNRMPQLVLNNIHLADFNLVQKFISDFPRPNNLLIADSKNQYEATMARIKKSKGDIKIKPNLKKSKRDSYQGQDSNLEIQAGLDELRNWDEEDSSWRIANDVG